MVWFGPIARKTVAAVLYLVRHGETDWNKEGRYQGLTDIPLNECGRQQAAEAARNLLRGVPVRAVVSSPLLRAFETGAIIARSLGLGEPGCSPQLVERSFGEAEGRTRQEAAALFPGAVPGKEPLMQVLTRAMEALSSVAASYDGEHVVVTTHSALIRAVLNHVAPGVADTQAVPILHGSIHSFHWSGSAASLLRFNDPLERRTEELRVQQYQRSAPCPHS
jgi:probable phosphoglycerate mutase